MKKLTVLFLLVLMVSFTASALPARGRQIESTFVQDVPADSCGSIDATKACYSGSTTQYLQCTAKGNLGQKCQMVVYHAVTKVKMCASVTQAGGCQCDPATLVASGSCQYMR